ncbi:MAG: patatin-like phospholipase family protein [Pseudomonadota bacterium]|nr:patatin-like phospholipase family protein [Pseudomonadota bacterium]
MPTSPSAKVINLALQGGGSHGAFTWGVLHRLLDEEPRLMIEGISGTSAGALNAAALAQGYAVGGAKGAQAALASFWQGVGKLGSFELPQRTPVDMMLGNWNVDTSPWAAMADAMQRAFSPYQTNPFNFNPLRDLASSMLDIEAIRACKNIKLFVSATNVETGRIRVFKREDITIDALMASACLPLNFQAVKIDGVPYWDGGYVGNPSIYPMIYDCDSPDIVVVQINPLIRKGTPDTPIEIINRLNEITFNASLISEMRAIAFVQRLVEEDHLKSEESARLKSMNIHVIGAEEQMRDLGASSKMNAHMDFLLHLKELGQLITEQWLSKNWDMIGVKSSVDIKEMFL